MRCHAVGAGMDEVFDAFAFHGLAVDVQHAFNHLNAIAWQANNAFDEIC